VFEGRGVARVWQNSNTKTPHLDSTKMARTPPPERWAAAQAAVQHTSERSKRYLRAVCLVRAIFADEVDGMEMELDGLVECESVRDEEKAGQVGDGGYLWADTHGG
jgi:hypothetical protein